MQYLSQQTTEGKITPYLRVLAAEYRAHCGRLGWETTHLSRKHFA
jgi:hypothetical protein